MAEGTTHKRTKAKAAGKSGKTEVPISGNRRLDAVTGDTAVEVETSGQATRLEKAALRLKAIHRKSHILVVPQKDMKKAAMAMRSTGTKGTVRNLSGTRYSTVGRRSSTTRDGRTPPKTASKRVATISRRSATKGRASRRR